MWNTHTYTTATNILRNIRTIFWSVPATSFPGSLILPPLRQASRGGKMRDPGNEVAVPAKAGTSKMDMTSFANEEFTFEEGG